MISSSLPLFETSDLLPILLLVGALMASLRFCTVEIFYIAMAYWMANSDTRGPLSYLAISSFSYFNCCSYCFPLFFKRGVSWAHWSSAGHRSRILSNLFVEDWIARARSSRGTRVFAPRRDFLLWKEEGRIDEGIGLKGFTLAWRDQPYVCELSLTEALVTRLGWTCSFPQTQLYSE